MRRRSILLAALALAACSKHDAPGATPGATPATHVDDPRLYHPDEATERAPETFKAKFSTTKGDFVIQVTRAWAPRGADRFYNLVKVGYFDGVRFYRAIEGFMVQFGIHPDPAVDALWSKASIPDDPVVKSNTRGFVTFAMAGPNTRSEQVFINYVDGNRRLDAMGFAPFGQVVEGMSVVDSLYKGYGEMAPRGRGPDPSRAEREGDAYFAKKFPELDRIKTATIL